MAWSPDGQLASGSSIGPVILWDLTTGHPEQSLQGHPGWVTSLAWSPDGQLASGSLSDQLILIVPKKYTYSPCKWIGRNLTLQEWIQYRGYVVYRPTCPNLPTPVRFVNLSTDLNYLALSVTGWIIIVSGVLLSLGIVFLVGMVIFRVGKRISHRNKN